MKKVLLVLFAALAGVCSLSAQNKQSASSNKWYVGGSLNIRTYGNDTPGAATSTFGLAPEFGYQFNDQWGVGGSITFASTSYKGSGSSTGFSISPYARWSFYKIGGLSLFADGGFEFTTTGPSGAKVSQFAIGITPGLRYDLNRSFALVAHVGYLGFIGGDDESQNGFILNAHNDLSFGFYYTF